VFGAYKRIYLTSPSWLVKCIGQREYRRYFTNYKSERLLDIGCGSGEKRHIIPKEIKYTGVDHPDTAHNRSNIDIYCTAYALPISDNSYDSVFCSGVLEHLEEPELALREAYRVLKLGGHAIYTVPLFWHLHEEPRDFYRYTKHGIRYLFEKAGFEIAELKPLSGFWVTFGSEFNYYINRFNKNVAKPFFSLLIAINNLIFFLFEKIDSPEQWTWMYFVIARKK